MKVTQRWIAMLAVALVVGACGGTAGTGGSSGPAPVERMGVTSGVGELGSTEMHNEGGFAMHGIDHAPDSVWAVLPEVYERLGIDEAGAVPAERLYGARNVRVRRIEGQRLSTFIDCGTGPTATPRADEYDVRMTVVTRVLDGEAGASRLETTVQAAARPRGVSGNPVDCASRGSLEARIATLVNLALLERGR